jgi:hypothetical protein
VNPGIAMGGLPCWFLNLGGAENLEGMLVAVGCRLFGLREVDMAVVVVGVEWVGRGRGRGVDNVVGVSGRCGCACAWT